PFPPDMGSSRPEVPSGAKWQTVYADPTGRLDLKALFSGVDSALYARSYVFSPKRQKVTVTATGENPMRVWVNDVSASQRSAPGGGSEETFTADLKQGWNVVLIKVANAGRPATLAVRVAGDGLRTAGTPAELPTGVGGQ